MTLHLTIPNHFNIKFTIQQNTLEEKLSYLGKGL